MRYIRLAIFSLVIFLLSGCGAAKYGRDALLSHEIGEYYRAIENTEKQAVKKKIVKNGNNMPLPQQSVTII